MGLQGHPGMFTSTRRWALLGLASGALTLAAPAAAASASEAPPELWPEEHRAFLQDGPGLLLPAPVRERLRSMPAAERQELIDRFLEDPLPESPENELVVGIARRRRLVERELLTWLDDRALLLFLHGEPVSRETVDCGQTFVPIELWSYSEGESSRRLVLYQKRTGGPYRLWLPLESKLVLYQGEMANILQQLAAVRYRGRRFDLRTCDQTPEIDAATGVVSLRGYLADRPSDRELLAHLGPPADLASWAREAAATPLPDAPPALPLSAIEVSYPERVQQRLMARFLATVPAGTELGIAGENDRREVRLALDGVVEQEGEVFERFRVRYKVRPPAEGKALALEFDRSLRPDREFLLRYHVVDEITGAEVYGSRGFRVPQRPEPATPRGPGEGVVVERGEEVRLEPIVSADSLLLAPPDADVIFGVWRADALVIGPRIRRVVFSVDGVPQLTKAERPFSAEIRLAHFPREQVVRAEGFDADGNLVAVDEVRLNEPRGAFRVRIVEPSEAVGSGPTLAVATVTVPDERRVETVEFRLNEVSLGTLEAPPWEMRLVVPGGEETTYLTVVARLDDGRVQEEVRFLQSPELREEVNVRLVELLTTVTDKSGRPVSDLAVEDFAVFEDKRPQEIRRFERVDDVSLCVGIALDTSASMSGSLEEAKKAAVGFLRNVVRPTDLAFAVAFASKPVLLVPPTDDVMAVENSLDGLQSAGWTTLHDSVVSSLYYFRAFKGQRALVVLSDGDDSTSYYTFEDALEYARRAGVVIYTVGLNVGSLQLGVRNKLTALAGETGGRSFFIGQAAELDSVYREIEEELRSQYLLTYASDNPKSDGEFRTVDLTVQEGRLKARTIRGYYP
jgi:VWFA-related protein